jgi:hypothetical protein
VLKVCYSMAYSHRQIRLDACNHSGFIAEMVTAQALASCDLQFHGLTPENNATLCEGKVYINVNNHRLAFCDPKNARYRCVTAVEAKVLANFASSCDQNLLAVTHALFTQPLPPYTIRRRFSVVGGCVHRQEYRKPTLPGPIPIQTQ